MSYRLLLAGKKQDIIDNFFQMAGEKFECQTTSMRKEDIDSHITYFQPHAFVYCTGENEKNDIMEKMSGLSLVKEKEIPLILNGESEDCFDFLEVAGDMVALTLAEPFQTEEQKQEISRFLEKKEQEKKKKKDEEELRKLTDPAYLDKLLEEELSDLNLAAKSGKQDGHLQTGGQIGGQTGKDTPEKPGNHILIIDDDTRMLRILKEELREKYNVATAVSGKIALNFLEKRKTDLILLDYVMPDEDGPAVLKKLRENNATKDIPVVFLTGINDRNKIEKVLDMNPQGYLLKPIKPEKLFRTIRQIIG
ncbi:response regulator domain-containing protein [Roseburia sp. CAG:303]|nr:response regulator domain-containing protein [Roseburia sp. CAG:303]